MAVILTVTGNPSSYATGAWPAASFNDGRWRYTFTFTNAIATYSGFHAMWGQPTGGIWIVAGTLKVYRSSDDAEIASRALTGGAGTAVTFDFDMVARTVTITGASTGNGTVAIGTGDPFNAAQAIGIGNVAGNNAWAIAGTMSNVDDVAGLSRTATVTVAADAATAASRALARSATFSAAAGASAVALATHVRSVAMSAAAGAASSATATAPGALDRTVALAVTVDAVAATSRSLSRSGTTSAAAGADTGAARALARAATASAAVGASTAATVAGAVNFGPGADTSGIWTFGRAAAVCTIPGGYLPSGGGGADADGRTPTSITTEVSGSTFYVAVARPVATVDKTVTDNKGNTYTSLRIGDYGGASPWESQILVSVAGAGGAAHSITANSIVNDELTMAMSEIRQCAYLAGHVTSFTAVGSTQISPTGLNLKGPGWVYVDWFGEGPVSGAEGFDWTIVAVNEGATVGSQWQVVDSRVRNHTDGWIQWKRWRRYYAAATSNIQMQLATISPNQGARWYAAAFMEANVTEATAAMTVAAGAITAALARLERSASSSAVAHAQVAALGAYARSAATSAAAGAQVAGVAVRARTAALGVAVDAAVAATASASRSATLAIDAGAVTAAVAVRERAAGVSILADVATSVSAIRGRTVALAAAAGAATSATTATPGQVDRAVALTVAVDAATSVAHVLGRSVSLSAAVGAATAVFRRLERTAALAAAAGASTAAVVAGEQPVARPLPAALAISVVGAAPFRMAVE